MRAKGAILLVGVFCLYWLMYQLVETGLLLPILLIVAVVATMFQVKMNRRVDASPLASKSPHSAPLQTAKATPQALSLEERPPVTPSVLGIRGIDAALDDLPDHLLSRSGSVFYTGKEAFEGQRPLYLLGLNPGGDPQAQLLNTVAKQIQDFRQRSQPWSAYADESWEGARPGTWGMQPRVLHMLQQLGLDPREVPTSNVVFVRTRDEAALKQEKNELLNACWPVHQAVIDSLKVRAIVCFGGTAGRWARDKIGANQLFDSFKETNARGWTSEAHRASDGRLVVTVTHPGRADWRNPAADPTPLIRRALGL